MTSFESESTPEREPTKAIRISDADRQAVIDRLQQATKEGRLSLSEFEDRSALAFKARYEDQLAPLYADLPTPVTAVPAQRTKPGVRFLLAAMGARSWAGQWLPAERNVALTFMAGQEIDLTAVQAEAVDIVAFTFMGGLDITVPPGAAVDHGGLIFMGGTDMKLDPPTTPPTMRVRIRSWGMMSGCDIHTANPKRRLGGR